MIDTIRIQTPSLSSELIDIITSKMKLRKGVDLSTGENMYVILSNTLCSNTHDRTITINIRDYEIISIKDNGVYKCTTRVECEPYLIIETSVHKLLLGHNVFGGIEDIEKAINIIIDNLSYIFEIDKKMFGDIMSYKVLRLDYSKAFRINDVSKYIDILRNSYYPRRESIKYKKETLYFPGSTTTIKFYDKYKEYYKHDFKKTGDIDVLNKAKNILRVEVEIKKRKLVEMFESLKISDISMEKVKTLYNNEVEKIFKIRTVDSKSLIGSDVYDLLVKKYGVSLASVLFSSYNILVSGGINLLKQKLPKTTYYRHIKYLKDSNIYWHDVQLNYSKETKEFINFIPYTNSEYAIN